MDSSSHLASLGLRSRRYRKRLELCFEVWRPTHRRLLSCYYPRTWFEAGVALTREAAHKCSTVCVVHSFVRQVDGIVALQCKSQASRRLCVGNPGCTFCLETAFPCPFSDILTLPLALRFLCKLFLHSCRWT